MAGANFVTANYYGFLPYLSASANTQALGPTADYRSAFSFVAPPGGATLSKVIIRVTAVPGTLQAGDLRCDIYSDNAGAPDASLGNTTTVDALPTGAAFVEFSSFSGGTTWTEGTTYWIVVTCPNAATDSRYVTILYGPSSSGLTLALGVTGNGLAYRYYNAASWGTALAGTCGVRLEFSSPAIYVGHAISAINLTTTATAVYTGHFQGALITTPANGRMRVRGICAYLRKTGTPTFNVSGKIKIGASAATASVAVPATSITAGMWQQFWFGTVQELAPSTEVRIYLGVDSGGDTSNYVRVYTYAIHNSAASKNLLPFNGNICQTVSTDESSWTDTGTHDYEIPCMGLILDGDQEYGFPGMLGVHPGMAGGIRG